MTIKTKEQNRTEATKVWHVLLYVNGRQESAIIEAIDIFDLMVKCPDAIYVKQIG